MPCAVGARLTLRISSSGRMRAGRAWHHATHARCLLHALVGRRLPVQQKPRMVTRGTEHRFSTSRYARVGRRESSALLRLLRSHRAWDRVVLRSPLSRVKPSGDTADSLAPSSRPNSLRPSSFLYPYPAAVQRSASAAAGAAEAWELGTPRCCARWRLHAVVGQPRRT